MAVQYSIKEIDFLYPTNHPFTHLFLSFYPSFYLVEREFIEYNELAPQSASYSKFKTDNIAQIVLLEDYSTGSPLIVANTHLYWNPQYPEVKLAQAKLLILRIQKFRKRIREQRQLQQHQQSGDIPIILSGDFNSNPNSDVYQLLTFNHNPLNNNNNTNNNNDTTTGNNNNNNSSSNSNDSSSSTTTLPDNKSESPIKQNTELHDNNTTNTTVVPPTHNSDNNTTTTTTTTTTTATGDRLHHLDISFKHDLPLADSYATLLLSLHHHQQSTTTTNNINNINSTTDVLPLVYPPPTFTIYIPQIASVVDYIFYSTSNNTNNKLQPVRCLSLLDKKMVENTNGLPNEVFPSDHIPLLCEFILR
ncbi:Glucose-repressible alcohol dehydrogenase transcriptional effector [Coelomomyces lativittatus]|nr:Glucose-repressible alcohol dehydrogenase transcriptional effector [Coelomomyces lativittatus]